MQWCRGMLRRTVFHLGLREGVHPCVSFNARSMPAVASLQLLMGGARALPHMCVQVVPTLALHDTMQYVRSKTATVCYGMCLGMGGFLLTAGGEKVGRTCDHALSVARAYAWIALWQTNRLTEQPANPVPPRQGGAAGQCPQAEACAQPACVKLFCVGACPLAAGLPLRHAPLHPYDAPPQWSLTRSSI